jgi:hypothetical protein
MTSLDSLVSHDLENDKRTFEASQNRIWGPENGIMTWSRADGVYTAGTTKSTTTRETSDRPTESRGEQETTR